MKALLTSDLNGFRNRNLRSGSELNAAAGQYYRYATLICSAFIVGGQTNGNCPSVSTAASTSIALGNRCGTHELSSG